MKILVVEDDPNARALMEAVLAKQGYAAESAAHGADALAKAQAAPPDLIISDIMMPEMDGFLFCRRIKEDARLKHIPVILYTGTRTEKDEETLARSMGASRFIAKPAELSVILNAISEELEKSKKGAAAAAPAAPVFPGSDAAEEYLRIFSRKLQIKERELVEAREKLAGSEARYRNLFENMLEGLAYCRILRDGRGRPSDWLYLDVNAAFERITGLKNVIGRPVSQVLPTLKTSNPEVFEAYGRVAGTGRPEDFETYVPALDVWFHVSVFRPKEDHFMAVFEDVTRRKRADEEVKLKELYLDNATDAVIVHDFEGNLAYVNRTACLMHGYTRAELLKIHLKDLNTPRTAQLMGARLRELEEKGELLVETEHRLKGGGVVPVEVRARVVEIKGKKMILSSVRDIGARKQAEAALRASEERQRRMQKLDSIGGLSGGIAHDLNNLLGPVLGYADMLRKSLPPGDPRVEDLAEITKAADRAAALVRQLLAFSRRQVMEPRIISLNESVESLRAMLRRVIGERITLTFRPDPAIGAVKADPGQIEQVILNLVLNARDAMPQGGRIEITTSEAPAPAAMFSEPGRAAPARCVTLSVRDTGHGMDEAVKARLFEPFFTTKEPGRGTGLGLSTAYGIIKQSGGDMQVESSPGEGAVFTIYLPLVENASAEPAVKPAPGPARPAGRGSIMLVEDDESMRKVTRRILTGAGYAVFEAVDGGQALKFLSESREPMAALVTDLVMPGMDGIALGVEISSRYPGMKILCMSGYVDKEAEFERVLASKAVYLQKPFSPDILLKKMDELLKS